MIVVVADGDDVEAAALADRWAVADAVLMTPEDLSRPGWSVRFPGAGPTIVVGGAALPSEQVTGVLVRLQTVSPFHLPHLQEADRQYAAAEMTAFLAYWLTALDCPVINRPSPAYLVGPAWTNAQWLTVAARLGLAVSSVSVSDTDTGVMNAQLRWVTVVGEHALQGDAEQQAAALALARHAGVELLAAGFDLRAASGPLAAVSVLPSISDAAADALLVALGRETT